jgi:hypothetical protein
MNERLKEIAIKAQVEHCVSHVRLQEFAELIVRECNQAVLEVPLYYKDYRSQIEEAVIHDCARAVLEKFGVDDGNL